jgi:ribosomal protein S27E
MFILNSLNQLEKAVTKARTVKPIVRIIKFGLYSVKGSKGNFYTVKCEKVGNDKVVTCECKGAERGLVCFHSASVLELHCTLAKHKATV